LSKSLGSTLNLSIARKHCGLMNGRKTREKALRNALREVLVGIEPSVDAESSAAARVSATRDRERRRRLAEEGREQDSEFIRGIEDTAKLIREARSADGEPVYRTDACYRLLGSIERGGGWPSISGVARMLRVSKQAARQQVIAAAGIGLLETLPDPFDRRSIQIGLTLSGKRELAAARAREVAASDLLLRGLGVRERRLVAHVLRVMRARLSRAERERRRRASSTSHPQRLR
jgi:DNA-binding MarR family transcriptional regulator